MRDFGPQISLIIFDEHPVMRSALFAIRSASSGDVPVV